MKDDVIDLFCWIAACAGVGLLMVGAALVDSRINKAAPRLTNYSAVVTCPANVQVYFRSDGVVCWRTKEGE